jgi:hypothetical protein
MTVRHIVIEGGGDIPGAPTLNDAGQECLLRIVCNIWPKAVDKAMVMTIGSPSNFRCGHCQSNIAEYASQRGVKHLLLEVVEFLVIGMMFVCQKELE